jgi:hypothetical protein
MRFKTTKSDRKRSTPGGGAETPAAKMRPTRCRSTPAPIEFYSKVFPVIISLVCMLIIRSARHERAADAFHLSFANRLGELVDGVASGSAR